MKYFIYTFLLAALFLPTVVRAQIDTVIVETYYVSDANDAVETDDGTLPEGSVTYRVYIGLSEGVKLKSIFADAHHALKINSSLPFFNNARGKSFGKDVTAAQLKYNTVALDTWLTLGLATANHTGVSKTDDTDTSILGGSKNRQGMLIATNPLAGIPLLQKDGLITKDNLLRNWLAMMDNVFYNTAEDTTIFGGSAIDPDSVFISNNFLFTETNGYVAGAANKILVAQFTTKGDLRFELNVEVLMPDGKALKCVANNPQEGEEEIQYLTYPNIHIPVCGCPDVKYLEYNPQRECDDVRMCTNKIVLGCTDKNACNYNPEANMSDGLCCYPGNCANRDISLVCPELGESKLEFEIFPNPVQEELQVEINAGSDKKTKCLIVDPYGRVVKEVDFGVITDAATKQLNVSGLSNGLYMLKIYRANENGSKVFIKE